MARTASTSNRAGGSASGSPASYARVGGAVSYEYNTAMEEYNRALYRVDRLRDEFDELEKRGRERTFLSIDQKNVYDLALMNASKRYSAAINVLRDAEKKVKRFAAKEAQK